MSILKAEARGFQAETLQDTLPMACTCRKFQAASSLGPKLFQLEQLPTCSFHTQRIPGLSSTSPKCAGR